MGKAKQSSRREFSNNHQRASSQELVKGGLKVSYPSSLFLKPEDERGYAFPQLFARTISVKGEGRRNSLSIEATAPFEHQYENYTMDEFFHRVGL